MKYSANQITQGEDELILNYQEINPKVEAILSFMGKKGRKIQVKVDQSFVVEF